MILLREENEGPVIITRNDAGVPASNASPSAAIEFLKFIASPAAAPSWLVAGLELAEP
jgi:ABC-type glycerol-3-phosphate transport system substrate-binding protein